MSTQEKPVAWITGGAQGIGRGICERFFAEDFAVCVVDCDGEAGREAMAAYDPSQSALFLEADVSDEHQVEEAMNKTIERFGRLDVLVNNAGIADPYGAPVEVLALEDWRRWIDTNLTGAFLCTKHAVPHLRASNGSIVNIASTRAIQSEPNHEAYAASKGGLLALTHALAISLGPDVRVNCISPGWIEVGPWQKASARKESTHRPQDRAQHPAGRVGQPEDIANLVLYLAGPMAGFITGQNFIVDGGMTRKMIYED